MTAPSKQTARRLIGWRVRYECRRAGGWLFQRSSIVALHTAHAILLFLRRQTTKVRAVRVVRVYRVTKGAP